MAKGKAVQVWLSGTLLAELDRRRGDAPRGRWLREAAFHRDGSDYDLLTPEGRQRCLASLALELDDAIDKDTREALGEKRKALVNLDAMCRAEADRRRKDELPDTLRQQTRAMEEILGQGDAVDRDIEPPPKGERH